MKLSSAIISTALSCALLLLPLQATAAEDDKAKLADLKNAISTLEKQLNKRDKDKNNLVAELKKNEIAASASSRKIRLLNRKINTRRGKLAELDKQQRQLTIDPQSGRSTTASPTLQVLQLRARRAQ
jgi:septal ring factor EnvC (AmiA/AmiB activator)